MAKTKDSTQENSQQQFVIHNIFLKDSSFEVPNTPEIFTYQWHPKVDFDLDISSRNTQENLYESILDITLTVKVPVSTAEDAKNKKTKDKTEEVVAFLVQIKQGGIFTISGYEKDRTEQILAIAVPNIIFPYARETVANLILRGGFPQLILPPVNFEAMYKEHLEKNQAAANN